MKRALILALLCASATSTEAQYRYWEGRTPPRFPPPGAFDRGFVFCRLMYASVYREAGGMGWSTDYPQAEINFMVRLSELTLTGVAFEGPERPSYYVVRLTDDALFGCPFIMASDVGTIGLTPEEGSRLRTYLLKGGFLWVDDFWGTFAWHNWAREIGKVLPPAEYPIMDVPLSDPIFSALYEVAKKPQITSIQFWRRAGGTTTSERGTDSAEPEFRAIRDRSGRILVLMTHNTDIADAWEREGEDIEFFYKFAHDGYAVGINILLHAMTH
ncbi:MAG: DUF4159 domain-containing protein [Gemmatimonadetes bacterium]|nr:DUF4159 domain-containing protein [Gemmatimonadota bacterium]